MQPGSIDTPKPVTVFHSTFPAAAAVESNKVTSPTQMRASNAVQGSTTCCCTTPSMLMPNSESCRNTNNRKNRSMGKLSQWV